MANLHDTFIEFNDSVISLNSQKKGELRISRNAVREDIKKYFKNNRDKHTVSFKGQGSYMMNTTILPISGEYDVDDGVYIFGKEEDRPTPATAHNWIYEAVNNRTAQETIDKNTCVRVQYAKKYHIDLPIYYKVEKNGDDNWFDEEEIPELAHKAKGWIKSDPYEFKKWFDEQAKSKPQLKRIVRYLKAWSDFRTEQNNSLIFPSGMVLTILASNNYVSDDLDDIALVETLKKIQSKIDNRGIFNFIFSNYECYRPTVDKNENLLDKYSSKTTKDNFLDNLDNFINSGKQAIEMKSKKDACAKWQKHLGDRFPCSNIEEDVEQLAKSFFYPDRVQTDNKSA